MKRLCVVLAMVALIGAGCGGGGGDNGSETPRITAAAPADEHAGLLTAGDVQAVPGLEQVTATDINDLPLYENPDPRGPCGAGVPPTPISGSVGRAFTGADVAVFELVTAATKTHDDFLAALRADVHPGCRPYESRTNTGDTQRVSDVAFLNLDDLGHPAVGWTATIIVKGQTIKGGVIAMRVGDRFAFVQFQGTKLLAADGLRRLARQAAARLG